MPDSSVEFHEAAGIEFDAAFDWYLQRSPDAAARFAAEVDRAAPFQTRRLLLRHFPFTLIYRLRRSGAIQIVAVAHTSRQPGYWKKRL